MVAKVEENLVTTTVSAVPPHTALLAATSVLYMIPVHSKVVIEWPKKHSEQKRLRLLRQWVKLATYYKVFFFLFIVCFVHYQKRAVNAEAMVAQLKQDLQSFKVGLQHINQLLRDIFHNLLATHCWAHNTIVCLWLLHRFSCHRLMPRVSTDDMRRHCQGSGTRPHMPPDSYPWLPWLLTSLSSKGIKPLSQNTMLL